LGLKNATAEQVRSEDHKLKYNFIVSRAVTTLPEFITATKHLVPSTKQALGKQSNPCARDCSTSRAANWPTS
jgi:16S rRNA (guanine527-N7)-methyltransferase